MPLLQVLGKPIAPSGKHFTTSTRLSILYMYAYADDDEIYPIRYDASFDTASRGWKPLGTPNGTVFYVPGPETNEKFPKVSIHEFHVYSDGTSQSFYRDNVTIVQTSPGVWNYANVDEPAEVINVATVAWVRLQVPLGA